MEGGGGKSPEKWRRGREKEKEKKGFFKYLINIIMGSNID